MSDTSEEPPLIAYFSMEVGLEPAMPTYSGGLGVLAGDFLSASADLGLPVVGMTLLYRKGYFRQRLDSLGNQYEGPALWSPEELLHPVQPRVAITIEGRRVWIKAWRYTIRGISGHVTTVYYLDTALPENSPWDQALTDHLYGGDDRYRLCQEAVLGIGGLAMLRALGYDRIQKYHMNEGHAGLLVMALLEEQTWGQGRSLYGITGAELQQVRKRCVFTTHTPIPAAHDQFPMDMAIRVLGEDRLSMLVDTDCCLDEKLNMTYLALSMSHYINGVALSHRETARNMYPNYPVDSITNGVHAATWTSAPFQKLYDSHIPQWRRDNLYLRNAIGLPLNEILTTHAQAKRDLLQEVERRTGVLLDSRAMTLGFARRTATYKRHTLLFSDLERLKRIAHQVGPVQLIYAGKAHPQDDGGKAVIKRVFEAAAALKDTIKVVYLEEYDMTLAKYLCAGVDLWLNTPQKPQEASGTSGMKAALNGVPSLSVLDGWWVEGCVEGVTGWAIGEDGRDPSSPAREAASLYEKLEHVILPMFYSRPNDFARVMRAAIALNGSFFNAQRMARQYMENAYRLNDHPLAN